MRAHSNCLVLTPWPLQRPRLQTQSMLRYGGLGLWYMTMRRHSSVYARERGGTRKQKEGDSTWPRGQPSLHLLRGVRGMGRHLSNHRALSPGSKEAALPITVSVSSLARPQCVAAGEGMFECLPQHHLQARQLLWVKTIFPERVTHAQTSSHSSADTARLWHLHTSRAWARHQHHPWHRSSGILCLSPKLTRHLSPSVKAPHPQPEFNIEHERGREWEGLTHSFPQHKAPPSASCPGWTPDFLSTTKSDGHASLLAFKSFSPFSCPLP